MAVKKQGEEAVAEYGKEELIAYAAELFGLQPEALQGALHGTGDDEQFSVESASALIDKFMNRKVN